MIAKLTIVQGRLHCIKVRARAERDGRFWDEASPLRQDMEAIVRSYAVASISRRCLRESNRGAAPRDSQRTCAFPSM